MHIDSGFYKQLGILNIVEAMELSPELAYPLYVAASVDWYVISFVDYFSFLLSDLIFHLSKACPIIDIWFIVLLTFYSYNF